MSSETSTGAADDSQRPIHTSGGVPGTWPGRPDAGTTAAFRIPAEPVVQQWKQTPSSVPAARHHLRETLRSWGLADLADASALVLSELLSNAVQHAHGPDPTVKTLFCRLTEARGVRIEVHDADSRRLPIMQTGVDNGEDDRGRGLLLVDACTAHRWGTVLVAHGKTVWGEVSE